MPKTKEAMPIQVHFKKSIRSDGELVTSRIVQGDQELHLTTAQAVSLADQLHRRFAGVEPTK